MAAGVEALEKALTQSSEEDPLAPLAGSAPGLGPVLAARVLSKIGDDPHRFPTAASLTDLIKPRAPWKGVDEVEFATAEWVDWFNHRRIYDYCGDIPPAELEQAHYADHIQPDHELEMSHH